MAKSIASNFLTFLVFTFFLLAGLIMWGQGQYNDAGPLGKPICLSVKAGSNMRSVANSLESRGAVANARIFRIGTDYSGKTELLKAGNWLVPKNASMAEIAGIITRGGASSCGTEVLFRIGVTSSQVQVREFDPEENQFVEIAAFSQPDGEVSDIYMSAREKPDTRYRVIVSEGATVWQTVESLKSVDILAGDVAELPSEGSLAPDSYEISAGDTREGLITRMQTAQEAILARVWENRADGIPLDGPYEALILASIIEKETGVGKERALVSSVFTNRLRIGMRLETDPTVRYGITNGRGELGRGLRRSELKQKTPYNTYSIDGLPPTPIANPGRASLEAAVNPAESDFLYFVADGTGGHAFSKTLAEHNRNVANWRKIEAERASQ
ncbi:MAG: endolytic transglycosylase MltG [Roseovarius sp.]|nr:endolytic transglycosylase MltG [Roseovarius sp.]MCY4207568.1 endolytic transglycosylase MltG [Roseovarius sp.]MCY4317144.1 endolytic transglycosylase MltG [Roseovarius sp.]